MALVDPTLPRVFVLEEHSQIKYSRESSPSERRNFIFSQLKTSVFLTWLVQALIFGALWLTLGVYGSRFNLGEFSQVGLITGIIHFGFAFAIIIPLVISFIHTSNVIVKTKSIDVSMFTLLVFPLITFIFAPGTIAVLYFLY